MEVRRYIAILLKWAWLMLLAAVLAGGTSYLVSSRTMPTYRASVTLLVNQAVDPSITDYTSILTSERLAKTYAQLLTSRRVLEQVIENLGLEIGLSALTRRADVSLVRDTQLIVVAVADANPHLAASIANEIPRVFTEQNEAIQSGRYAASLESLSQEMGEVDAHIGRTEDRIRELREREMPRGTAVDEAEIAGLEITLGQLTGTYYELLNTHESIRVAEARALNNILVVDPAAAPTVPVSPRTKLNTALGTAVGLMLALGLVVLIEYLDDTIKTPEDIERVLGLPSLGNIARFAASEEPRDNVVTAHNPRSLASEAYRMLRTNVQYSTIDDPQRVLLVTSPGSSEGKTTTAANLAVAMAQHEHRVILVDADLRKPSLHDLFELHNSPGFGDMILNGKLTVKKVLQSTDVPGLEILACGNLPPNPAELLDSRRAQSVLDLLAPRADVVILDTAPALAVADAAILAAKSTGVILVVEQGRTRAADVRRAKEAFDQVGAKLLGVVLNKVRSGRGYGYYGYPYYDEIRKRWRRKRS